MLAIRLMWLEVPLTALHDLWCSWLLPLAIRRHRHDFMQQRKVRMPARQASQGCAALSVQYSIPRSTYLVRHLLPSHRTFPSTNFKCTGCAFAGEAVTSGVKLDTFEIEVGSIPGTKFLPSNYATKTLY